MADLLTYKNTKFLYYVNIFYLRSFIMLYTGEFCIALLCLVFQIRSYLKDTNKQELAYGKLTLSST